jgi:hypothetical protein
MINMYYTQAVALVIDRATSVVNPLDIIFVRLQNFVASVFAALDASLLSAALTTVSTAVSYCYCLLLT